MVYFMQINLFNKGSGIGSDLQCLINLGSLLFCFINFAEHIIY